MSLPSSNAGDIRHERRGLSDRRHADERRQLPERRTNRRGKPAHHASAAELASLRFASPPRQEVAPRISLSQVFRRSVAEAAYLKAEKRGFSSGFEIDDWLQAENETRSAME